MNQPKTPLAVWLRKEESLTALELSVTVGTTPSAVRNWAVGLSVPRYNMALLVIKATKGALTIDMLKRPWMHMAPQDAA